MFALQQERGILEDYRKKTDEQLIAQLRAGDDKITDFIMDKYKFLVRKKARAMYLLGGENEDLIQEGMIGLFKAVRDFDESQGASFHSFAELCVSRQMSSAITAANRKKHIPLNSYVSLYERENDAETTQPPLMETLQTAAESDPEKIFFGKEYSEVFENTLRERLSPLENRVLYLHLLGTDYRTIAELIGKSPKTVDNALQRIKSKAEQLLVEE